MTEAPNTTSAIGTANRTYFSIGSVQVRVLTAIAALGEHAYGAEIERRINQSPEHNELALGQIYMTLKRLERRGFVSSHKSTAKPVKGGRSRKVFSLTKDLGMPALQFVSATPNQGNFVAQPA